MSSKNDLRRDSRIKEQAEPRPHLDRNRVDPTPHAILVPDREDKASPCLPDPPLKSLQHSRRESKQNQRKSSALLEKDPYAMGKMFDRPSRLFSEEYDNNQANKKPTATTNESANQETNLLFKINENLELKNNLLESEIRKLTRRSDEAERAYVNRLNESKIKVDSLTQQINALMDQNDELNRLIKNFQSELASVKANRNESRTFEISQMNDEFNLKLKDHLNFFTQKLTEKDQIISTLNKKITELTSVNVPVKDKVDTEIKIQQITKLEFENEELKQEISQLRKLNSEDIPLPDNQPIDLSEKDNEIQSLKAENESLKARIKSLEDQLGDLRHLNGMTGEQTDIFSKWLEIFRIKENEVTIYKNELANLTKENETLVEQLKQASHLVTPSKPLASLKETPSKGNIFFKTYSDQNLDNADPSKQNDNGNLRKGSSRSSIENQKLVTNLKADNRFGSFSSKNDGFAIQPPMHPADSRSQMSYSKEDFHASTSPRSVKQINYIPTKVFYNGEEIKHGLSLLRSDFNNTGLSTRYVQPNTTSQFEYYPDNSKVHTRVSKIEPEKQSQIIRHVQNGQRSERSVKKYIIDTSYDSYKLLARTPERVRTTYNEYLESSKSKGEVPLKEYSSRKYSTQNVSLDNKENAVRIRYPSVTQSRQSYYRS